jgi:hypothetical protein
MLSKKEIRRRFLLLIRSRYQAKRAKKEYKKKKVRNILIRKLDLKGEVITPKKEPFVLKMPEIFSLINNTNDLLNAVELGRFVAKKRIPLYIKIEHVKKLTPEAIALLIAVISEGDFTKIDITGGAPDDEVIRDMFIKSGFFNYVKSNVGNVANINLLLHQRSNKQVNTAIAKEVCKKGLLHTFGTDDIFEPLYDILIECMSNTHNHADPTKDGVYDWWLYTYFDTDTKITYYSFFDLGIGIFESISVKDYKEVMRKLGISKNVQLISDLYQGKIKSRTLLPERGKGLPQIYSYATNHNIKNLTLITNNVYSNMSTGKNFELEQNFSGTFYYWELHP